MKNFWEQSSTVVKTIIVIAGVAVVALLIWLLSSLLGPSSPGTGTELTPAPTATLGEGDVVIIVPTQLIPTPAPGVPTVTAVDTVNVRLGPNTAYPRIGLLVTGQVAEAVGVNQDGSWYAIAYPYPPLNQGWVSADFVTAASTEGLPVLPAPPMPPPTPTPPVPIADWRGEYFSNKDLQGEPALVRDDAAIAFDWGAGSPGPEIPNDNFSARWSINRNVPAGTFRFNIWVDDGVRLFVDDNLILDQWQDGPPRNYIVDVNVAAGAHSTRVEYYDSVGHALIYVDVSYLQNFPDWKAEYFGNANLSDAPVVVRNEPEINYNWGGGSPAPGVPSNNWSSRWSRSTAFPAGDTLFTVDVEGGVRMWVDGVLIVDSWSPAGFRTLEATRNLSNSNHDLRVDYNKASGNGQLRVSWTADSGGPGEAPTALINGPSEALVGEEVTFDANGSTVADGSNIQTTAWEFGDGGEANGVTVQHGYAAAGVYTVKLTLIDDKGLTGTATKQISISEPGETPVPVPPVAMIAAPGQGMIGEPLTFDASGSTTSGTITSYAWGFGDGTTADGVRIDKIYASAGAFEVKLIVTDDTNQQAGATHQVVIQAPLVPTEVVPTDTPAPEATATPAPEATAPPEPEATVPPEPEATVPPEPEATPLPLLVGQTWMMTAYSDGQGGVVPALEGSDVRSVFGADGSITGSAGCNTYNGTYTAADSALSVGPLVVSGQTCTDPEGVMLQETAYLSALQQAASYTVQGNLLEIFDAGGASILTYIGLAR